MFDRNQSRVMLTYDKTLLLNLYTLYLIFFYIIQSFFLLVDVSVVIHHPLFFHLFGLSFHVEGLRLAYIRAFRR
jgi:hypothetical protein